MEMNLCSLSRYFHDEAAAWELLESLRWPDGPVCPHCGEVDNAVLLKCRTGQATTSTGKVSYRRTWKCRNKDCRRKFSVLVGSIFEDSKVPVGKWLAAFYMLTADKNGVSAFEIHRTLGVTNKTAWFMMHRIREATKQGPLAEALQGKFVADESYYGGNPKNRHGHVKGSRGSGRGTEKAAVFSLIDAGRGEVRSRVVANVDGRTLGSAIREVVDPAGSTLYTDMWHGYDPVGVQFKNHVRVDHKAGEYVRDGGGTNLAENYFSQLKRSLDGTHHHVSKEHLERYLAEFDYRYNTRRLSDSERMKRLVSQTAGRRLTYHQVKRAGPSGD